LTTDERRELDAFTDAEMVVTSQVSLDGFDFARQLERELAEKTATIAARDMEISDLNYELEKIIPQYKQSQEVLELLYQLANRP
jgi:hypothetical protein